ncbi:MAG: ATP-binding protein, partial [Candidatus Dadabacteria bacterium]
MYPRLINSLLLHRISRFRGVVLTGARQVGKTFVLKELVKDQGGVYMSFDDPLILREAQRDPLGWIRRVRKPGELFIIDEAVKCPEIFSAVKVVIDYEDPTPSKIILASSGNYLLVRKIKESLAGRVALLSLYPLSWREALGSKLVRDSSNLSLLFSPDKLIKIERKRLVSDLERERTAFLLSGGFPEIWNNISSYSFRNQWAKSYFMSYLLPLASTLFTISKQDVFARLFEHISLLTSQLLNYSNIARKCGVSSPTVKSYLHYLNAMEVIKEVPQFFKNPRKRLVKMQKIYVLDPI